MTASKRPFSITGLAWLYILVGAAGFIAHFHGLLAHEQDVVWAELTEVLAIVAGVFLLRGQNWARWLAVAWIAFHVVLSAFHAWGEAAVHGVFFLAIAWLLFRPEAARYFRGGNAESP